MNWQDFDLLGDRVDPDREVARSKGRPAHNVTPEKANKAMLLAAFGESDDTIALALGISKPTLRKHYFSGGKSSLRLPRDAARAKLIALQLHRLERQSAEGNVAAIKELFRRLDDQERRAAARRLATEIVASRDAAETMPAPTGKKAEAARRAAEIEGVFAPPAGPDQVH